MGTFGTFVGSDSAPKMAQNLRRKQPGLVGEAAYTSSGKDCEVGFVWPPAYPTPNYLQMRYATVQCLAFALSTVNLTFWAFGFGPFKALESEKGRRRGLGAGGRYGTKLALAIEILLLIYRTVNEIVHDQFDLSGALHHGAFALALVLLAYNQRWQNQYGDLGILMQSLHFPMTLWYLGARAICVWKSPFARSLCIKLFRPAWWVAVGFRASCMLLGTLFAAGQFKSDDQATLGEVDASATVVLCTLLCLFVWLDWTWSRWFIRRVGNACERPVGDFFNLLCVGAGACLAPALL